ncbi:MAG TPA: beta-propeller fold lactonase family protein [Terriglobales bacterium]
MLKKISGVVAFMGLCALSLLLLSCGSSSSRPSGVVYVLTQGTSSQGTPGFGNNVSSFVIDFNNGYLTLINSNASACPPGNNVDTNPCGIPLNVVLDPLGANAFVLDQGVPCVLLSTQMGAQCVSGSANPTPPSIYPYTVNSDGSLASPGTAITWTANSYPDTAIAMQRDPAGQFLFVIDQGSSPSPGYPVPTPVTPQSCPHAPANQFDVCPSISVFAMPKPGSGSNTLTLASGSPFYLSKIPTALSAITFTPPGASTVQELLFVSNNFDICSQNCTYPSPNNDNTLSVYGVSSSGVLTEQQYSPYTIAAVDPLSVIAVYTNPPTENTGNLFVYVGNQDPNGGHLYPFQVCTVISAVCTQQNVASNQMVPLATCPQQSCDVPPTSVGQSPIGLVVDPTNSFLYVASEGSNQVFGFLINTSAGKLTALTGSPQPSQGLQPISIALHPSVNNTGQYLFVSNSNSQTVAGFSLNTVNGSMSSPTTTITPAAPSGMAAH